MQEYFIAYCSVCGAEIGAKKNNKKHQYVCKACRAERSLERRKIVLMACSVCGAIVSCAGSKPFRSSLNAARLGVATCSARCTQARVERARKICGTKIAAYNEIYASERMKFKNPMADRSVVEKMIATKEKNGSYRRCPTIRGGNGKPDTIPQKSLAMALGWDTEVAVGTKAVRKHMDGIAKVYKLDVANAVMKVGIEIDGSSHNGKRKAVDAKKDHVLSLLGWKVLRFTNKQVMENLAGCVETVSSTISR